MASTVSFVLPEGVRSPRPNYVHPKDQNVPREGRVKGIDGGGPRRSGDKDVNRVKGEDVFSLSEPNVGERRIDTSYTNRSQKTKL